MGEKTFFDEIYAVSNSYFKEFFISSKLQVLICFEFFYANPSHGLHAPIYTPAQETLTLTPQ